MKEKQQWLRLDGDDGWQIVIPESDTRPHAILTNEEASRVKANKDKVELAGIDCPCNPKVNYLDKIIVHNSFNDEDRIEQSMKDILIIP